MEKITWSAKSEALYLLLLQTNEPHLDGFDKKHNDALGFVELDLSYCYAYAMLDPKNPYLIRSRKLQDLEAAKQDVVQFLLDVKRIKPDQVETPETEEII